MSTEAKIEEGIDRHHNDSFHSQSPPLEDQFGKDSNEEPEMLPQMERKPISHEQLVVEVKGIYAAIVIVEAKCIEIHEREVAAAKEKDPLKRTPLESHQWQALIALHKQVHILPRIYVSTTYRAGFLIILCRIVNTRTLRLSLSVSASLCKPSVESFGH